jgi:hypothetical protein
MAITLTRSPTAPVRRKWRTTISTSYADSTLGSITASGGVPAHRARATQMAHDDFDIVRRFHLGQYHRVGRCAARGQLNQRQQIAQTEHRAQWIDAHADQKIPSRYAIAGAQPLHERRARAVFICGANGIFKIDNQAVGLRGGGFGVTVGAGRWREQ